MEPEITEMAAMAAGFINSTNEHVFLTGKAGTGKTTFLRQLAQHTHKRFVILAPTGIAALNAQGVTLHSQFLLPFGAFIPERTAPADAEALGNFCDRDTLARRHPLNGIRRNVLRAVDLLIIDEVSMLRADLLDAIDFRMRMVKGRYDISFGGAQVLLIGDLYQLPPVVKDNEWQVLGHYYSSPHFFAARALQGHADAPGFVHIELDKIFRQKDQRFIAILNNFRNNTVTAADVQALNKHYRQQAADVDHGLITLTTHNRKADELNNAALAKLPGPPCMYSARVEGEFPTGMYPLPTQLELRIGAQIMFTRNDVDKAYFNGKLARVARLDSAGIEVIMADGGTSYALKQETWENRRYVVAADSKELVEEVIGRFTHYPIKLAWAITVHKAQGLTFDKAIIDVGNAFAPGQVYVALSRLRSLSGLILRTPIDARNVRSDQQVVAFAASKAPGTTLSALLQEHQRKYLLEMLSTTFSLAPLWAAADQVLQQQEWAGFADPTIRQGLVDLVDRLQGEMPIADKFRSQLQRLMRNDDQAALLDRLDKGSQYYTDLLLEHIQVVVRNGAVLAQLARTGVYCEALSELDSLLTKKLAEIGKAAHITRCILAGQAVTRSVELDQLFKARRAAIVAQVQTYLAEHPSTGKSGRRRKNKRMASQPDPRGDAGSERRLKTPKGNTYKTTFALHKQRLTVAEIAQQRGLTPSTIEGHFVRGIQSGDVDIRDTMPMTAIQEIAALLRVERKSLNETHAHFAGKHSYGRLRMVQAWLDTQQASDQMA